MRNKIFTVLETSAIYLALACFIHEILPIIFPGTHLELDWYNFRWVFLGFAFAFSLVLNYNAKVYPKKNETMFIDQKYGFITSKNKCIQVNPNDIIHLQGRKYRVIDISTEIIHNDNEHSLVRNVYVDEANY